MHDKPTDHQLVEAGLSLIVDSGLVALRAGLLKSRLGFEKWMKEQPRHRRVEAWIIFSTGAEYLIKGICLSHNLGVLNLEKEYPDIGTLHPYYNKVRDKQKVVVPDTPYLRTLLGNLNRSGEWPSVKKYCNRLAEIRNRDVHIFIAGVRTKNFEELDSGILDMLNLLLGCLPQGFHINRLEGPPLLGPECFNAQF
jgi:hypothetical protein